MYGLDLRAPGNHQVGAVTGTSMKVLRRCLTVPLPRDAAWELFTATGERRWAPGWDPRFPEGDDDRTPGTVFVTVHGTQKTTWVVVTSQPGERIAYARMSYEGTAGTVEVICDAAGPETTEVTVTYRLTALTSAGQHHLARFSDDFDREIDGWQAAIVAALS